MSGRKKITQEEFINRSNEVHNFKYIYEKSLYINNATKVIITCKKHGDFEQIPSGHWSGKGCEKCAYELKNINMSRNKIKVAAVKFIEKAKLIHGDRFDYSKVEYKRNNENVIIICSIHGEFYQSPSSHLTHNGCAKCSYEEKSKNYMHKQQDVITKMNIIHNFKYIYDKVVYTGGQNKIEIICSRHGSFFQKPSHHLDGRGCPRCKYCVSKPETDWLDFLKIPNECRQIRIKINDLRNSVDAYDPSTNTIYEFYGDYWHGNPEIFDQNKLNTKKNKTFGQLYLETMERENNLKIAGYNVISIWEADWKNQIIL